MYKFIYKNVQCTRVIDGDTIECNIMLTFDTRLTTKVRLARIDTPEMNEEDGPIAKEYVKNLVQNKRVDLYVTTKDSWGRMIAEVHIKEENLSDLLLESGLAVRYKKR